MRFWSWLCLCCWFYFGSSENQVSWQGGLTYFRTGKILLLHADVNFVVQFESVLFLVAPLLKSGATYLLSTVSVGMFVCLYVCMYVCMCVCVCVDS